MVIAESTNDDGHRSGVLEIGGDPPLRTVTSPERSRLPGPGVKTVTNPRVFEHCWRVIVAVKVVARPLAIHENAGCEM